MSELPFIPESREDTLRVLSADRRLAHEILFKHRRPNATPEAHGLVVDDLHGGSKRLLVMAFRGFGKSTLAEEAVVLKACYQEFWNWLLLGSSYDRACERLHSIKHEFETNERLIELFGELRGPVWTEDKIELKTGRMIQALGRGQALRGVKYLDRRPDGVLADDIETLDDVRTPEARDKTQRWFMADVIPACDPSATVQVLATPLDPESLPMRLVADSKDIEGQWKVRTIPIEYLDSNNVRRSTWPDRFPMPLVDELRNGLARQGLIRDYRREYLCQAEVPEEKPFVREMIRVAPQVRTWQAVYAMIDPARTVNRNSATTGCAVWSWIGNRLVVWESWAKLLMPDEIVASLFAIDDEFHPVVIGVEEDGLNEFLMQPIRREQARRGQALPVKALRAPKGKMDFIRSLQPFFNAREVIFNKELKDLTGQLLSFPTGRIDAPNALAYALKLRSGQPIYEDFGLEHVAEDLTILPGRPVWLAVGATGHHVSAALCQVVNGAVRIYADWVREGTADEVLGGIIAEAGLEARQSLRVVVAPQHFDKYSNVGLIQAANRVPVEVNAGTPPELGRPDVRTLLQTKVHGFPGLMVSSRSRWCLNGFAGGYARALAKQGFVSDTAEEGQYRVLLEAVESFVGLMRVGVLEEDRSERVYATARDGRRYVSALARPRG